VRHPAIHEEGQKRGPERQSELEDFGSRWAVGKRRREPLGSRKTTQRREIDSSSQRSDQN